MNLEQFQKKWKDEFKYNIILLNPHSESKDIYFNCNQRCEHYIKYLIKRDLRSIGYVEILRNHFTISETTLSIEDKDDIA